MRLFRNEGFQGRGFSGPEVFRNEGLQGRGIAVGEGKGWEASCEALPSSDVQVVRQRQRLRRLRKRV